ncbi:MAG TPA: alpha/beta hydrolase [Rhodoglobus sp.]|nr:alpha/beta hydrolase [Rhodoglobus sp.]
MNPRPIAAALVAAVLLLSACAPTGDDSVRVEPTAQPVYPQLATDPDIPVVEDVAYVPGGDELQKLDLCLPEQPATQGDRNVEGVPPTSVQPRPAVILVHGGSWRRGEKDNVSWRAMCQWFARNGYIAASIDYRLAPAVSFPAPLEDVEAAVRWMRDPDRVERYGVDPERIGLFGASAGGHLVSLVGTSGEGDWTSGTRVAAVVELSAPVDLHGPMNAEPLLESDILEFLGCRDYADCPAAALASPAGQIDPTDPPFFVAHSTEEFIPISQSDGFVAALRDAGVDTTYVTLEGRLHAASMLDDAMLERVLTFFDDKLGPVPVTLASGRR